MADAPTPAVRPILSWSQQEYINLVQQLNRNIPDLVKNVKSMGSTLQSLNLSTRDLEMRYRDHRAAYLLHMSFVRLWTCVSQCRKSQITFDRSSPMQHLAAIHKNSKNLQQEFHRCQLKCLQLRAVLMSFVPALQPHLSASGDKFGNDDEGYIRSFRHLSESLQRTNRRFQHYLEFMITNLRRTTYDTLQLAQNCKHLRALRSSRWSLRLKCPRISCAFRKCKKKVNIKVRIKSKMFQLKSSLRCIKLELADAVHSIEFLNKVAEKLNELQEQHHDHSTLFSQDHLAAIIQMRHDLDAINNL